MAQHELRWLQDIRAKLHIRNSTEYDAFAPIVSSYQSLHQQSQLMAKMRADAASSSAGSPTSDSTVALKAQLARLNEEKENYQRKIIALEKRLQYEGDLLLRKEEAYAQQLALGRDLEERASLNAAYIKSLKTTLEEALAAATEAKENEDKAWRAAEDRRKQIINLELTIANQRNEIALLGGEAPEVAGGGDAGVSGSEALLPRQNFADRNSVMQSVAWGAAVRVEVPTTRSKYIQAHPVAATTCKYLADGRIIATGGADGKLCLWLSKTGVRTSQLSGPTQAITSFALAPDTSTFAATSMDKMTYIWSVRSAQVSTKLVGHSQTVVDASYLNSHTLVTGSRDVTLRIWDLKEGGHNVISCGSSVRALDTAANGSIIASAHMDNTVKLWSSNTRERFAEIKDAHDQAITSVQMFSDQLVLTNSVSGELAVTDLRTCKVMHRYTGSASEPYSNRFEAKAVFSPDYQYILAGDDTGKLFVWRVNSGELVSVIKPPVVSTRYHPAVCVDWSPNGRQVCSVDRQGCLSIWDTPDSDATKHF